MTLGGKGIKSINISGSEAIIEINRNPQVFDSIR